MDDEPQQPSDEPADPDRADLGHRSETRDHGQGPEVAIVEGLGRLAFQTANDRVGGVGAGLHRHLGHARQVVAVRHQVAHDVDLGMCRQGAVGVDHDPTGLVGLRPGGAGDGGSQSRGARAGRPDLGGSGYPLSRAVLLGDLDAGLVHVGHRGVQVDLHAHAGEIALGHPGQVRPHRADEPVDALHQDDAGLDGVDRAVVAAQRPPRELAQLPRHLDPGGAAADDDEGHEAPALLGVRLGLGQLEGAEDVAPQRQSVVQGLHAARELPELVVTEVGARPPRRRR